MTRRGAAALVAALLSLAASAAATSAQPADHVIVIGPDALVPRVRVVPLNEPVRFVNRSGRLVHVELIGPEGEHHVFQVPGDIRAEFHRPGPHPYVVHFESGERRELTGFVHVDGGDPAVTRPACPGLTVAEACIDR